jgi:bacteriorhodopsin
VSKKKREGAARAAMSYARLQDIEEKSTIYPLRIAFSFLASAAGLSLVAALTYVQEGMAKQTYVAALSTIINAVAAYHYHEMIKVRSNEKVTNDTEWKMGALRHSDWAVTMPLLVLKLYGMMNSPDQDLILQSVDLSALLASVMVLLGAYVRLGLDEMASTGRPLATYQRILGPFCYLLSWTILVLLLIDLCNTYSSIDNKAIVYTFFLVWPCYGVVACLSALARSMRKADDYPKNVGLVKDVAYACLDVFSKAVFAWYTSSDAFGVSVLGS